MAGFGFHDLVLVRPAADAFDPKVIRASMGALFRVSFEYFDSFDDYARASPLPRLAFRDTRQLFEALRAVSFARSRIEVLSMGMSDSYRVAIEEGATMVRVGTALFGFRQAPPAQA
jgi:hypothetical protein